MIYLDEIGSYNLIYMLVFCFRVMQLVQILVLIIVAIFIIVIFMTFVFHVHLFNSRFLLPIAKTEKLPINSMNIRGNII